MQLLDNARCIPASTQTGAHERYQVSLVEAPFDIQFEDLILKLATSHNSTQVVILIDEYDKPLIDNLNDRPEAEQIRDTLKSFYTIIKAMDQYRSS